MTVLQWPAVGLAVVAALLVGRRVARRLGYLEGRGTLSTRRCGYCGAPLLYLAGYERSGPDYGGGSKEVDEFRCSRCGRKYRHIAHENFDSVMDWWGLKTGDGWEDLEKEHWPR